MCCLILFGLTIAMVWAFLWQYQKAAQLSKQIVTLDAQVGQLNKRVLSLQKATTNISSDYAAGTRFSGKITADACISSKAPIGDVGCSLTIGSSLTIQVVHGNIEQMYPWGRTLNFPSWPNNPTGKDVEVYAHQLDKDDYTLEGSSDYYVRIIN